MDLASRVYQLCLQYLRAPAPVLPAYVPVDGNGLPVFTFAPALSAGEQTTYNTLVQMAQSGTPLTLAQWQAGTWALPANALLGKLQAYVNSDGTLNSTAIQAAVGTIAPSAHVHTEANVTNLPADLAGKAASAHGHAEADTANLVNDLAGKAPSGHSHTEANVTNLVADLAAKAAGVHSHAEADTTNLVADLAAKAPSAHTHTEANVTSLVADLAAKAASSHSHAEADTTNLVSDLAGKAAAAHVHAPAYAALANDTLALALGTNGTVKLTVTANRTLTTTVPAAGTHCHVIILTSGASSFTITFGAGFKPTGTLATGTTTARVFVVSFISDGVSLYEVSRTAAMPA